MLFSVALKEFRWERLARRNYYHSAAFKNADQALKRAYFLKNPYRQCRIFHDEIYGETPLHTLDAIAHASELGSESRMIEMGSGRGRSSLFFRHIYNAEVLAIEKVPPFIRIASQFSDSRLTFQKGDMYNAPFSWATHVYLYGTTLSEVEVNKLAPRLHQCPGKIITTSYSLEEYNFTVEKEFTAMFPWGECTIYINRRQQ